LRTFSLTILFSLVLSAATVFASDILVLQGMRVKPFDDALRGFKSVCKGESKTVVVADAQGTDLVRLAREERPRLILAIGAEALNKVKNIRDIPVIYSMVLNPDNIIVGGKNFTGVNMNVPPEKYLSMLEKLKLSKLKIGILYDPAKSGNIVKNIRQAARSRKIGIIAREVRHPKEVPALLEEMRASCDLFWMLPDSTVITPETVEFFLLFSQQNRKPVITFAGKYVENGAMVSLDIDGFDLGKQAGEIANRVLGGVAISDIPDTDARKAVMRINRKVAAKLGINLNDDETLHLSN
jgi:putative ABC transport system substrate-binding protein